MCTFFTEIHFRPSVVIERHEDDRHRHKEEEPWDQYCKTLLRQGKAKVLTCDLFYLVMYTRRRVSDKSYLFSVSSSHGRE